MILYKHCIIVNGCWHKITMDVRYNGILLIYIVEIISVNIYIIIIKKIQAHHIQILCGCSMTYLDITVYDIICFNRI